MSEILNKRIEQSIGKRIKIFLINDFRFEGKLINFDEIYIEIIDDRTHSFKIILIKDIKEMDVLG